MSGGRLAGRYSLHHMLGRGGMGTVWLARDEMLDREVAVKELTLPEGLPEAARAEAVARSVREAQATAQLRHPGIVALHDVVVEYGRPWLIMELLRGRTLGEAVAQNGPLPPARAAQIGADVLEALTVAHAIGLQHRDVKPGNIFLTDSGRVVLTDFGIAKQAGQVALTETGLMTGSPGFVAPERLEGQQGGPESDLWALGVTLYAAVEGMAAYEGSAADRIRATLTMAPPQPRRAGLLTPVLTAMMSRDPGSRPDPMTTVAALRQVASGKPPQLPGSRDATRPGRAMRRRQGRPWALAGVVAAVLAVAVTAAVLLVDREPGGGAPSAFTLPVDLCSLMTPAQTGELLRTSKPPKGARSVKDSGSQYGISCSWTISGSGLAVTAERDSDHPEPWSMTPDTARVLMTNQREQWNTYDSIQWTWPEIGVKEEYTAQRTPLRDLPGPGEEAFAYELSAKGRVHTSVVYYRLANLVVQVEYATLAGKPTDDQIRRTGLRLAQLSAEALRLKG